MTNKARILVVDDQRPILLTYTLILQQQGYNVTGAPSCEHALEHLRRHRFDLLICDFGLDSGRSGFEVIDFARRQHPGIDSLLLTGYSTPEIAAGADQRGAQIVNKPVEVLELLRTVESLVNPSNAA